MSDAPHSNFVGNSSANFLSLSQYAEEPTRNQILEKVIQMGLTGPQLMRLQSYASSQMLSPGTPSPSLSARGNFSYSAADLVQVLNADPGQAQMALLAEKMRLQSQAMSGSNMNSSVPPRDPEPLNLSLGLSSNVQQGSAPAVKNGRGSGGYENSDFMTSIAAKYYSGREDNLLQQQVSSDMAANSLRIMGVDISHGRGAGGPAAQHSAQDSRLLDLGKGRTLSRDRDLIGDGNGRESSELSESNEDESPSGKKIRLSRQQSTFLEQRFFNQETLTASQKTLVAKELGLLPRQVEVWFQNRRARRRLKQAEMDCDMLRKSCKALQEENTRLQAEIRDLQKLGKSERQSEVESKEEVKTVSEGGNTH